MIRQCQRCGVDFDAKTNAKYCLTCRPVVHKEQVRAGDVRWKAAHRDQVREIARRCYERHKELYREKRRQQHKKKRQIEKLRAKLQVIHAKRQAELEKQRQLYNPPSMFDGVEIPIPSCLANLGMI